MSDAPAAVGYLAGEYPIPSHTFITREVDGLRARGLPIYTYSLRRTAPERLLTDEDLRNDRDTVAILPPRPAALLRAHLTALVTRPALYLNTLRRALRAGETGVKHKLWGLFYFAEGVLVWHMVRSRGIGHLHAHFHSGTSVAMNAARIGAPDGLTWSFTMHGPTEFDEVVRYGLAEKVADAAFVACIGAFARSQLMRLSGPEQWDKLAIVRCGIDVTRFAPAEDRAAPEPGAPLHVLCVGRLVADKGQLLLVEAVARLRERGVPVRLTLVGDGAGRADVEAAVTRLGVGDAVDVTGALGQDRVRALYGEADVFCLPSFAEGIPVVLMEAMAMGVPVVSTRVMGIPELVTDGDSGVLVRPGEVGDLVDVLARLAADPAERARLAAGGREAVVAGFDADTSSAALAALMRPYV